MRLRITDTLFECDHSTFAAIYGIYVAGEYDPLIQRLSKQDVLLDAGACVGGLSILASTKVRRVYAVEPEPHNFNLLRRNIALNRAKNVMPINAALSNEVGTAYLSGSGEGARLSKDGVAVKTVTLDALSESLGETFTALKLDVEGSEVKAIVGQMSLNHIAKVAIECEDSFGQIREYLMKSGFNIIGGYEDFITRTSVLLKLLSLKFFTLLAFTPPEEILEMIRGMLKGGDPLLPCAGNDRLKMLYAFREGK
jgi:FkbM family methyltransferase